MDNSGSNSRITFSIESILGSPSMPTSQPHPANQLYCMALFQHLQQQHFQQQQHLQQYLLFLQQQQQLQQQQLQQREQQQHHHNQQQQLQQQQQKQQQKQQQLHQHHKQQPQPQLQQQHQQHKQLQQQQLQKQRTNHQAQSAYSSASAPAKVSSALTSLSSFVALIEPPQGGSSTSKKTTSTSISTSSNNNTVKQQPIGRPVTPCKLKQTTASSVASIATTPTPLNTAINIAKAPPELVQKQPPWVFCTRYSDRPSSGPRTRRAKSKDKKAKETKANVDEKRPRTAFTNEQLEKLRQEFQANSYLDERRRKDLAERLGLNENQIKIWFQNKRAKMKKQSNQPNPLRGLLVAGGLYNHSTATSDCSESYANGNEDDNDDRYDEDDDDDHDDDNNNNNNSSNELGSSLVAQSQGKRKREHLLNHQQQCNSSSSNGRITFNNTEADTGMMAGSASKRMRVDYAASDAASESSRNADDLDVVDTEQVISVS